MPIDYTAHDATALAALVHSGEVSPKSYCRPARSGYMRTTRA